MRMLRQVALAVAAIALSPALTFGAPLPGDPGNGISATPHDFVAGPANTNSTTAVGLCTFCHTPHKAQSTRLLWNHTLSVNTFSWGDAKTTTGGTNLPNITPGYQGASVRCLSCHDGTVAIGDVSWFNQGPAVANATKMGVAPLQVNNEFTITGGGLGGSEMKGNHPVAIPFPFANSAGTYNGNATGAHVDLTEWQADPTANGIRLFTDASGVGTDISAGTAAGKTGIECSSCHDPHNGKGVPTTSDFFLRGNYTGADANYICNKCHKK